VAAVSLHCDSCGAPLPPDSSKCAYCGQVAVILIQGYRFNELLRMYLSARQYRDAAALASKILEEHPYNSLAWAVKGLTSLDNGFDVAGCMNCFQIANRHAAKDGVVEDLRRQTARIVLAAAVKSIHRWCECPDVETFDLIHEYILSAERLCPSVRKDCDKLLAPLDDHAEKAFGMLYVDDSYQRKRRVRTRKREKTRGLLDALRDFIGP
jgi:hypothetical protein